MNNNGAGLSWLGCFPISIVLSTTVTAVAGVAATISSTIVGSGRLAATGKRTLVLANMSHRYSGSTYIEDSLLQLSNGTTLEAAAGKWKAVGRF